MYFISDSIQELYTRTQILHRATSDLYSVKMTEQIARAGWLVEPRLQRERIGGAARQRRGDGAGVVAEHERILGGRRRAALARRHVYNRPSSVRAGLLTLRP